MDYLRVKNWDDHQHYKTRNPPWIKLHRALLDDFVFCSLPDESKAHLMLIWLLASQSGGKVPAEPKFLARKIGAIKGVDLDLLVKSGFLIPDSNVEQDASNVLAERKHDASKLLLPEEKRREDKKTLCRVEPDGFVRFWNSYPATRRRVAKAKCLEVWVRHGLESTSEQIVAHVSGMAATPQWTGGYEPAPLTYLNQRRWEDGLPERPAFKVAL